VAQRRTRLASSGERGAEDGAGGVPAVLSGADAAAALDVDGNANSCLHGATPDMVSTHTLGARQWGMRTHL
jgi:hypothetical protein